MKYLMATLSLACSMPLAARDIPVPTDKGWQHAQTGLILMPQVGGLQRTKLTDSTASEHDVTVQFDAQDKTLFATLFLFQAAIPDVGIWFDRARTLLEQRDTFKSAAPATADPVTFSVGQTQIASSIRQAYSIPGGRYRSTALAVMPVGDWIVSMRLTSEKLTADQLDARLQRMIADIRWPKSGEAALPVAAATVQPCATPLKFGKARQVKADGADIMGSLLLSIAAKEKKGESTPAVRPVWCREGEGRTEYGVYRADADETGYALALFDAGRVVSVHPAFVKAGNYSISLRDVDGSVSAFPAFNALPDPDRVYKMLSTAKPMGSAKDKNITLDPEALKDGTSP